MVIAAHPDDADFGPAATAARWIDAGSEGWLVCCTSGDQGGEDPDADPLELAALRETEQRGRGAIIGYAGVTFLHQPGRRARQRPRAARAARPRDPDVPPGRRPRHRPETIFYKGGGINHTDHRAAGIAAVDAVYPAARNPMAFPWLARRRLAAHKVRRLYLFWSERSRHLGRRVGDARPQDRRASRPRQPDPRPRRAGRADPRLGGRGGRADRGRGGGGVPASSSSTTTRTKDRADAPEVGLSRVSSRRAERPDPAPLVPDLGQTIRAAARASRPSRPASGRRPRSARYSSAATVASANRSVDRLIVRPVADAHRVEPRVAERQRQVALRRVASVRPATEPIEAKAERSERRGRSRAALVRVNIPQNG